MLKLYPSEKQLESWKKDRKVHNIFYDELIFSDPTEEFYEILLKNKNPGILENIGPEYPFSLELEQRDATILDEAIEKTKTQQKEYTLQLESMEKNIAILKNEIATLENKFL
ncbi:hypothetical protein BB561_003339 [Smittium simulii]|uniref:YEATS domain-containing protein n=1 Tax=Smittium simulii TaxID=133385 RepID=A0A2T9YLZ8_9FUNG|nr:hypothetical protein BB561_003339 [Smittium simulii]